MARYFKPTQKRAIIKSSGLYMVKTPDMMTYHRTFEEAVDSYHMLYGPLAPIAGPIDDSFVPQDAQPVAIPVDQPMTVDDRIETFKEGSRDLLRDVEQDRAFKIANRKEREAVFDKMAEDYSNQVVHFEEVMRKSHGIRLKLAQEKAQRMKDRVAYCKAMQESFGGSLETDEAIKKAA